MHVRDNKVKQRLQSGETVFSSSVRLPEAGLCEILGYAGFDFVLLDGEHGALDASTADRMIQSCFAGETVPIVRVLRNDDPQAVMHMLDLGAQGILIPHCRTAADARALQQAALYPPVGRRGFGPGRESKWGRAPMENYFEQVNERVVLLALIEDPEGVENVEEIAAVGLDVLWVGTGDLSIAYGVPGQRNHPLMIEAAEKIVAACRRHKIAAGFPAADAADARWAVEQGFQVIGFGGAESYIMQTSRRFLEAVGR
jgi:2-keto-3-deoxy-L-rhamnonate aldolase RhmA